MYSISADGGGGGRARADINCNFGLKTRNMRRVDGAPLCLDANVREKRNVVMTNLLASEPHAAISVWVPPKDPVFSLQNALINDEVLTLWGTDEPKDGRAGTFLAPPSLWKDWRLANEIEASLRFVCHMITVIHSRKVTHTTAVLLCVNRASSMWRIRMTCIVLDCGDGRIEVVSSQSVTKSEISSDLQVAYGIVDERHLRHRLSKHFEGKWSISNGKKESLIREKQSQRAITNASKGFKCKECATTQTNQRR